MLSGRRRLFLFAHLENAYSYRAWVILDGDEAGKSAIAKPQEEYPPHPTPHSQSNPHRNMRERSAPCPPPGYTSLTNPCPIRQIQPPTETAVEPNLEGGCLDADP